MVNLASRQIDMIAEVFLKKSIVINKMFTMNFTQKR